ncbi:MAG: CPCC family cysteine-rich protein [Phycisphaerales bacterium JB054]
MPTPADYNRMDASPPGVHSVSLGRDKAIRPWQPNPKDPSKRRYQCVCCGEFTLDIVDECDVCPECGWEDMYECNESPDRVIRPNYISLNDARSICAKYGAGAACAVNRAKGMTRAELESMSTEQRSQLKGLGS